MNNLINESYISFEISKLLKEKGFDVSTRSGFQSNGLGVSCDPSYRSGLGDIQGHRRWNSTTEYFAQSTITVAIEWIKVNIGVWIYCETDNYGEEYFPYIKICSKDKWEDLEFRNKLSDFGRELNIYKSSKEAIEAAIKYCLIKL